MTPAEDSYREAQVAFANLMNRICTHAIAISTLANETTRKILDGVPISELPRPQAVAVLLGQLLDEAENYANWARFYACARQDVKCPLPNGGSHLACEAALQVCNKIIEVAAEGKKSKPNPN